MAERAYQFLRGNTTGDLRFDEHIRSIRYVISHDGRLAIPAMAAMLEAHDLVLFVPEFIDDAMQVQVTISPLNERTEGGHIIDRWRIYHGDPEDIGWARLEIDCAKFESYFIDQEALVRENTLAKCEPAICRDFNADRTDELGLLCLHFAHLEVESPVLVGIDPLGLDVRGRFDVIRIPASKPMNDEAQAREAIERMIDEARRSIREMDA